MFVNVPNALVRKMIWFSENSDEECIQDGVAHSMRVEGASEGEKFGQKAEEVLRCRHLAKIGMAKGASEEVLDEDSEVGWHLLWEGKWSTGHFFVAVVEPGWY